MNLASRFTIYYTNLALEISDEYTSVLVLKQYFHLLEDIYKRASDQEVEMADIEEFQSNKNMNIDDI